MVPGIEFDLGVAEQFALDQPRYLTRLHGLPLAICGGIPKPRHCRRRRTHYPTRMKPLDRVAAGLLVALWAGASVNLVAWSEQGHRIVALAAQENLSETAKRRVTYLLGRDPKLVEVATWADEVARARLETEAWHSIAIPPGVSGLDLNRDCPVGDCITAKVRECIASCA